MALNQIYFLQHKETREIIKYDPRLRPDRLPTRSERNQVYLVFFAFVGKHKGYMVYSLTINAWNSAIWIEFLKGWPSLSCWRTKAWLFTFNYWLTISYRCKNHKQEPPRHSHESLEYYHRTELSSKPYKADSGSKNLLQNFMWNFRQKPITTYARAGPQWALLHNRIANNTCFSHRTQ